MFNQENLYNTLMFSKKNITSMWKTINTGTINVETSQLGNK